MAQWAKMTEMIDTYRETHQALFRFKKPCTRDEAVTILSRLGTAFRKKAFELSDILSSEEKGKAEPTEPIFVKLLYAKENHKYEIHMELEWLPSNSKTLN